MPQWTKKSWEKWEPYDGWNSWRPYGQGWSWNSKSKGNKQYGSRVEEETPAKSEPEGQEESKLEENKVEEVQEVKLEAPEEPAADLGSLKAYYESKDLVKGEDEWQEAQAYMCSQWLAYNEMWSEDWDDEKDRPWTGKRHELVPKKANLKEQFEKAEPKNVTTLMLRNVPNAYDRETLMEELDGLNFKFNFLYLPIDSATKNNVGYAFVNFEDERGAQKCMHFIERGYYFKGQPHNRRRPAIVSVAHLQGLEANLEHYSRTQVFFAPLPCQRPWVADSAQELLSSCLWAPLGFGKLVQDASVRPGTSQDDQSFRRRGRDWWNEYAYEMPFEAYGYYFPDFEAFEYPAEFTEATASEGLVDALSQMLRTGSQPVAEEADEEPRGWFGWPEFLDMERSSSPAEPTDASLTLVLLNVPFSTTEWDLRQIIEHVGVHSPMTVSFEPGMSPDVNKVTLNFRNKIDLEIADVTLSETCWNEGGAPIQIYKPEAWMLKAVPRELEAESTRSSPRPEPSLSTEDEKSWPKLGTASKK